VESLTSDILKGFIDLELDEFTTEELRKKHGIASDSSVFYNTLRRMVLDKKLKKVGRGTYRKIKPVHPVKVFGRVRKPPIKVHFPRCRDSEEELSFAKDIIFREGDLILLSGQSNKGKTALCMNFCAANIASHPVLMGNEYTTIDNEPSPRFLSRMDSMDWVEWSNGDGEDSFTLLPVREDYAEHIVRDKLNIIDWINLDASVLYGISSVMEGIKREVGKGVAVITIQKKEGESSGRGGQFTKDFADCELLLDQYGHNEILLTIGKVKESKGHVSGRMFAYLIMDGVKIINFREVVKCPTCRGQGQNRGGQCEFCEGLGKVDKGNF